MLGCAVATLPVSFLRRSMAENSPTPPAAMMAGAREVLKASASSTRLAPPGLNADTRIWSALKSVGLMSTRTPLASVHSVMPGPGIRRSLTTRPGVGTAATSAPSATRSVHGVMVAATTAPKAARISASVGTASPGLSGTLTATTRFAAPARNADTAFTSSSVMAGSSRCTAAYSKAMPGAPSPVRKWFTYSSTKASLADFSRSAKARS